MRINEKYCKKYMRLAKHIAEDENPCLSRHIGVVIVDPVINRIKGTGFNGPPEKTPHPDEPDYLRDIVWPQLTEDERLTAKAKAEGVNLNDPKEVSHWDERRWSFGADEFVEAFANKGICPRRIIGVPSGARLELCSCEHGEKNAIVNCGEAPDGCWMFCWCGVPCWDCTKLIIASHISKVICFQNDKDYSYGSRWLLRKAGVELEIRDKETLEVVNGKG